MEKASSLSGAQLAMEKIDGGHAVDTVMSLHYPPCRMPPPLDVRAVPTQSALLP